MQHTSCTSAPLVRPAANTLGDRTSPGNQRSSVGATMGMADAGSVPYARLRTLTLIDTSAPYARQP